MAPEPEFLPFDEGTSTLEHLQPLVDWLVTFNQRQRSALRLAEGRAAQAEQRAEEAEQRAAVAQRQAHEEVAAGMAELRRALDGVDARARERERQLLDAMHRYLVDVGEVQDSLLHLARAAIGAVPARDHHSTPAGERPGVATHAAAATEQAGASEPGRDGDLAYTAMIAPQWGAAAMPSAPDGIEPTTDEHRLIDLHNRMDMRRLEEQASRLRPWSRRQDRQPLGRRPGAFAEA